MPTDLPIPPTASVDQIIEAVNVLKRFRDTLEDKDISTDLRNWIANCLKVEATEGGA